MSEDVQPSPAPSEQGECREKVGPGRPPKHSQFKKGQSGNPGGKVKGQSVLTLINKMLAGPDGAEVAEAFIKQLKRGSYQHAKEIIERQDGKVPDKIMHAVDLTVKEPFDWDAYRRAKAAEDSANGNGGRIPSPQNSN